MRIFSSQMENSLFQLRRVADIYDRWSKSTAAAVQSAWEEIPADWKRIVSETPTPPSSRFFHPLEQKTKTKTLIFSFFIITSILWCGARVPVGRYFTGWTDTAEAKMSGSITWRKLSSWKGGIHFEKDETEAEQKYLLAFLLLIIGQGCARCYDRRLPKHRKQKQKKRERIVISKSNTHKKATTRVVTSWLMDRPTNTWRSPKQQKKKQQLRLFSYSGDFVIAGARENRASMWRRPSWWIFFVKFTIGWSIRIHLKEKKRASLLSPGFCR